MLDECFKAAPGRGAFLNERPIHASRCKSLRDAMVAISFSANVPRGSIEVSRFVEAVHTAQSVRRTGSAALNLCYVGAGRLDAYFASSIQSWDVAAGVLIAREAGAVITSITGRDVRLTATGLGGGGDGRTACGIDTGPVTGGIIDPNVRRMHLSA